jgi:peptide-methionine (S)-S-oxide reductase
MATEKATFGAGCFWQVEVEFRNTPGVTDVQVGYCGGDVENPTYEQVCSSETGHAEVVEVTFDPDQVSYEKLLEKFFELHDPTQLDRQGPDVGPQYRSVIFAHSPDQELAAFAATQTEQAKRSAEVVTEVSPAQPFWPAEDYHQRYLEKKGQATCRI